MRPDACQAALFLIMKKTFLLLVALFLCACSHIQRNSSTAQYPVSPKVLIDPASSPKESLSFAEQEFIYAGFSVVNRNDLEKVLEEIKLAQSGLSSQNTDLDPNNLSTADILVKYDVAQNSDPLTMLMGEYSITTTWVSTKRGETILSKKKIISSLSSNSKAVSSITRSAIKEFAKRNSRN